MARIFVRLQEIKSDPALLSLLFRPGNGGDRWADIFYVGEWLEQKGMGRALWYLKFWELENIGENFRVVYAHNTQDDVVYVLAVCPRDFDYDPKHWLTQRIVSDYDNLRKSWSKG